jgi:uncharacterized protein
MITYVDTSTLLKLIIEESGTEQAAVIWATSDTLASATLITVEARAALAAAARDRRLTPAQHRAAKAALATLVGDLHLVAITDGLLGDAAELAETEGLRGYDAVYLAAALSIGSTVFTSADADLCTAAARRGLHIANPLVT